MTTKQISKRLTLSEIKARTTGHFFDRASMRFFSSSNWPGAKQRTTYKTRYDKETGINYVVVTDPWGKEHYHLFDEVTGALECVNDSEIPAKFAPVI